jgi:hypothetical protein
LQEFLRVGYYVQNEYEDEALRENPPDTPVIDKCVPPGLTCVLAADHVFLIISTVAVLNVEPLTPTFVGGGSEKVSMILGLFPTEKVPSGSIISAATGLLSGWTSAVVACCLR